MLNQLTKDEFERQYADVSGYTVEQLHEMGREAIVCDCGSILCLGWQMVNVVDKATMMEWLQDAERATRVRAAATPENEPTTVLTSTIGHIGWDEMPNLRAWAVGQQGCQ